MTEVSKPTNEVTKIETALAAVENVWGAAEDLTPEDVVLPQIRLAQPMTPTVLDDKASNGDFFDSNSEEILAKDNRKDSTQAETLEIIVFSVKKYWTVRILEEGEWRYVKRIPFTPENASTPFEEEINGILHRNQYSIEFYCLLPKQLKDNPLGFPYVACFAKTSLRAGKKIAGIIAKMRILGQPSAQRVFVLDREMVKGQKENSAYWIFKSSVSRETTAEEMMAARHWYEYIKNKAVNVVVDKIDKLDEGEEAVVPPLNNEDVPF